MDNNFVNYSIASKMLELGFNDKCIATINGYDSIHINGTKKMPYGTVATNEIPVPTWSECFDWFREKYDLHTIIDKVCNIDVSKTFWNFEICFASNENIIMENIYSGYKSYYEARENAVNTNLEIIKNNQNVKK